MFRSLGSVFCVVVMAAFVFGCGGGGGTAQMMEQPPVDQMPPPDEPTDAEQIAEARQAITTILSNARTRAQEASSVSSSIRNNADAMAAQITNATNNNTAAQAALALIENANSAAIAATTPAAAQTALANARAAQSTLNTARSAITSIQSALQTVANARRQRETDERALTNNSSLIQHVRENKLVFDAVLAALDADSIDVGQVTAVNTGNNAAYPYYEDRTADKKVSGVRKVTAQGESSTSKSAQLTGPGMFRYGFDLKDDANKFVNAYTDIQREKRVRNRVTADAPDTNEDERYDHVADDDYLLLGIWLEGAAGNEEVKAFAFGSQPITAAHNFCGPGEGAAAGTATLARVCGETSGLATISTFVGTDKDVKATYRGDANGTYLADGKASYFDADVEFRAEFVNEGGIGSGSIEGEVKNIKAGGESLNGDIDFIRYSLPDLIGNNFGKNAAAGVVEGENYRGQWTGQFFGFSATKSSKTTPADPDNDVLKTITTTYSPAAPGSVAGSFYVVKETAPAGDAALIGAFGAHRR